jgi:hypothetical protein
MWMNDSDGDGWGSPSTENPYFNTTAMHSYSVGEDFNHQQAKRKIMCSVSLNNGFKNIKLMVFVGI